jgi:hypothetical protein
MGLFIRIVAAALLGGCGSSQPGRTKSRIVARAGTGGGIVLIAGPAGILIGAARAGGADVGQHRPRQSQSRQPALERLSRARRNSFVHRLDHTFAASSRSRRPDVRPRITPKGQQPHSLGRLPAVGADPWRVKLLVMWWRGGGSRYGLVRRRDRGRLGLGAASPFRSWTPNPASAQNCENRQRYLAARLPALGQL